MIIDIIPMPIKVRTSNPIEMSSPLWLSNTLLQNSEELWITSRNLRNIDKLYRYKMVEYTTRGAIIEHIVLSFKKMCTVTLGCVDDRKTPVELFLISSKIVEDDKPTHAYRHKKSICRVLEALTGVHRKSLDTVHNMYMKMVGAGIWQFRRLDAAREFLRLKEELEPRLEALVSSEEITNELLLTGMGQMAEYLEGDFGESLDTATFMDVIHHTSGVPSIASYDKLGNQFFNKESICSFDVKKLVLDKPSKVHMGSLIATHDIFPIDDTVAFSLPEDVRWDLLPLIDQLYILPYTDVSITVDSSDIRVNYAATMLTSKPKLLEMPDGYGASISVDSEDLIAEYYRLADRPTFAIQLATSLMRLAISSGFNPKKIKCTLVKTFREDVYIEFSSDSKSFREFVKHNHVPTRYYLDLTMCTLGTRGIVTEELANTLTPDHY